MGDASFEIFERETGVLVDTVTTVDGTLSVDLSIAEPYRIVETETGLTFGATFNEAGQVITIIVLNAVEVPVEEGEIRIIKRFCETDNSDNDQSNCNDRVAPGDV